MIKADKYYRENLTEILENGCLDENPRPSYRDGVKAHSKFITQVFEKYDISKGEFPITTLRNTAIKTGIKEVLAIYQTQSNTKEGFHKNGVTWWDDWMNDNGNIGRAYSHNIESHRVDEMKKIVVVVDRRLKDPVLSNLLDLPSIDICDSIDGEVYNSEYRGYGDYIIIEEFSENRGDGNRSYIKCQFLDTGYISVMRKDGVKKGQNPKNNLTRTKCEIGYLDDYKEVKNFSESDVKSLKEIWGNMIKRCHGNDVDSYYEDVFVHQRWHSLKNFLIDVRYLPQYILARESSFKNWHLDKDYYGSNCYSKDTCVFLDTSENSLYRKSQINPIKIIDGDIVTYELSYSSLARTLNLSRGHVRSIVNKGVYNDLIFERIDDPDNLYRYELSRNQINDLLTNLVSDPFGRRHMTNFWNWSNIDKKELVECAYSTHWSIRKVEGVFYIDMTLIQRSQDAIMATYINKSQYVALQMMVANHVGYEVGNFSHFIQNYHIYDRHVDAAKEILSREPIDINPHFKLNNKTDFYNVSILDFEVFDIDGITKIKSDLEIAI